MFKHIMVPVDLGHVDKLTHAMAVAADLAGHYTATVTYVGVAATAPSALARTPEDFQQKLAALAQQQAEQYGHSAKAYAVFSHDPAVDLDQKLIASAQHLDIDLVVMASHLPNIADMVLPNHGGKLARHTKVSVLLVRHA